MIARVVCSFNGKTMANGAQMNPHSNNAASRTLPLGTIAKVTNLETGKSAVVQIEDRGPYIKGRIVDLTPRTAHRIGITRRKGIARDLHSARDVRKGHAARRARYTREARRAASARDALEASR